MALDLTREGFDRLVRLVGQIALVGAALEQLRPLLWREAVGEPERPLVLRGSLAVRTQGGCARAGLGREAKHGGAVSGGFGVVREPLYIGSPGWGFRQRVQRLPVELEPPDRRERCLHGEPRELVPERHTARAVRKHPGRQAFVEITDNLSGERLEQPELDVRGRDRNRLDVEARQGSGGKRWIVEQIALDDPLDRHDGLGRRVRQR